MLEDGSWGPPRCPAGLHGEHEALDSAEGDLSRFDGKGSPRRCSREEAIGPS